MSLMKNGKKGIKEIVFILPNGEGLNRRQFCNYFEKKVLRTIRKFMLIPHFGKESLKEVISLLSRKEKSGKFVILNDSLDDIASGILSAVFSDIKSLSKLAPKFKFKNRIFIRPFYLIEAKEIEVYAKLKNMKINKKRKSLGIQNALSILNSLEIKHPEIKHAVVNSFLQISNLNF